MFVSIERIKYLVIVRLVNDMFAPVILAFAVPLVVLGIVDRREQRLQIGEVVCERPISDDVAPLELRDGSDVVEREIVEIYLVRRP